MLSSLAYSQKKNKGAKEGYVGLQKKQNVPAPPLHLWFWTRALQLQSKNHERSISHALARQKYWQIRRPQRRTQDTHVL